MKTPSVTTEEKYNNSIYVRLDKACFSHDLASTAQLIEENHYIPSHALTLSIRYGFLDGVKLVVEKYGICFHKNTEDAFIQSIRYGYVDISKYLISKGADIHENNDSALRAASFYGSLELVKILLDLGADLHAEDNKSIQSAAAQGHLDIFKYFVVEKGYDISNIPDYPMRNNIKDWIHQYAEAKQLKEKLLNNLPIQQTKQNLPKL